MSCCASWSSGWSRPTAPGRQPGGRDGNQHGHHQDRAFEDKAPITVKNFLGYVEDKHYDGTIFHRVIDGFMIQGGGFEPGMKQKKTKEPIKNESSNGLSNATRHDRHGPHLATPTAPPPSSSSTSKDNKVLDGEPPDRPATASSAR